MWDCKLIRLAYYNTITTGSSATSHSEIISYDADYSFNYLSGITICMPALYLGLAILHG